MQMVGIIKYFMQCRLNCAVVNCILYMQCTSCENLKFDRLYPAVPQNIQNDLNFKPVSCKQVVELVNLEISETGCENAVKPVMHTLNSLARIKFLQAP